MSAAPRERAPSAVVVGLGFASAALLALQQHLVDRAADLQRGVDTVGHGGVALYPEFVRALPFPVADVTLAPPASIHLAVLGVAVLQTAVLFGLYRVLRGRVTTVAERAGLTLAAVAMLLIALNARTLLGFDAYAYAGYAKLDGIGAAYAPPATRFPDAFAAVNTIWGTPITRSYYGPVWIVLDRLVAGPAATLGAAIFALRLLEVAAFVAIAAVLARRRAGAAALALFALNPAVHAMYVANAHNDLVGVAFVMLALVLAARAPLLAAACVALAGCVKLPLAATALLVFAGRGRVRRRIVWVGVAAALTVAGSLLLGGGAYLDALAFRLHQGHAHAGPAWLTATALKGGLVVVAALALAAAFARALVWRAASWSFIALSSLVYPWYLVWSLPYAALERGALAAYLVLLPLAAAALEPAFPHFGLGQLAMLLMLAAAATEIVRRRSRPADD
ncbi:MAG TPA: hypothetical protein VN224_09475 [Xanthomonadales bacterium]|nr:hypothetical protein [Xanthomonadales bacterium]